MSIKNQSRLPIFALLILGMTLACLLGLNLIIDKISKITPPSMVRKEPPALKAPTNANPNTAAQPDDEYHPEAQKNVKPSGQSPNTPAANQRNSGVPANVSGSEGVIRRLQKNNSASEPPRVEASPPQQNSIPNRASQTPPPQAGGGGPGYGYPSGGISPEEQDALEREMEYRQQMMQEHYERYGPPPGYDYYEDYDFDPGYQGKLEDKKSVVKLSDEEIDDDSDEDDYLNDDYLRDDEGQGD